MLIEYFVYVLTASYVLLINLFYHYYSRRIDGETEMQNM